MTSIILQFALCTLIFSVASASLFINSFNSGKLSEDMKRRHDLDRTYMGSEELENILIRPQGMAYRRPGTEFIVDTNDANYVEPVPPTPTRAEAYIWSNNNDMFFLDPDHEISSYYNIAGNVCSSVDVDDDGNVVAVAADSDPVKSRMVYIDTELNVYDELFYPDAGWGTGGGTVRFDSTGDYVYLMNGGTRQIHKFQVSDGSEVWKTTTYHLHIKDRTSLYVDSDDHCYVQADGYAQEYDSDGAIVRENSVGGYTDCIWIDESDNDKIYVSGTVVGYYHLKAEYWDGSGLLAFSLGGVNTGPISNFIIEGDYIYAVGKRGNTWDGAGGNYASVWKLDKSFNVIAYYDNAYGYNSHGILLDHDGNLNVYSGNSDGGDTNAGIWVLDTDLNYISNHSAETDQAAADGAEGVKITYMDEGTPGYWIKYPTYISTNALRLIPFEYDVNDAYPLEFGHEYLGFLRTTP